MIRPILTTLLLGASVALLQAHPNHGESHTDDIVAIAPELGSVTIKTVGDFRVIESQDLPTHQTGQFPSRGNPNRISAQSFVFKMPLAPLRAEKPIAYHGYEFGVAINGVTFDPATGESWQGTRYWRQEAVMPDGQKFLGIDSSNAHVQRSGKYHYHGIPWGLVKELQKENPRAGVDEPLLIGWAADGYPIYYQEGIRSSWQLKKGERPGAPDGPGGEYNGLYTPDYEYIADSGDLDWLNGRYGATDEYPDGVYQYFVTDAFPYVPRYFLGAPNESFSKRNENHAASGNRMPHRPHGHRPPPM